MPVETAVEGPALYLCIDGGGTKTNVSIAGRRWGEKEVQILGRGQHGSSNHTGVGVERAMRAIGEATMEALRSLPDEEEFRVARSWRYNDDEEGSSADRSCSATPARRPGAPQTAAPFAKIWAGLSGVDGPQDLRLVRPALASLFGLSPPYDHILRVTNDCDLLSSVIQRIYNDNHLAPESSTPCMGGIVLIAGTGSIATAFGPPSITSPPLGSSSIPHVLHALGRLGGYGYLLGDEGSSYYVGQQTIKQLLRFFDRHQEPRPFLDTHRDPQVEQVRRPMGVDDQMIERSSLLKEVLAHFQVHRLADLMASIYSMPSEHERKLRIAGLSRLVMRAAFGDDETTDPFARSILQNAACRLSELVEDLCNLYNLLPAHTVLCLGGGMWSYSQFRLLVLDTMRTKWNALWGWVETIDQPDQLAAISLASNLPSSTPPCN
ncbi:hypothetical protein VP01_1282g5 [Puccinia sorghi]|uniref:N-acetyl-D-glucosamine kinase n=1 Tax=Puccinia sorghi TaxID=27349 RepID=A0A0L6VNR2_9BASI|nr:hypothetical protein VP01_1282g5 [Puccinia sorghi]